MWDLVVLQYISASHQGINILRTLPVPFCTCKFDADATFPQEASGRTKSNEAALYRYLYQWQKMLVLHDTISTHTS